MLYLMVDPSTSDLDDLERDPDVAGTWFADGTPLDLGTAWHGIHFLLNGSAWGGSGPLYDAVLGGTPVGDPSTYEPVRYLSPAEVAAVVTALPTEKELVPRFTHQAMRLAEVFPERAWDEAAALTEFLLPAYRLLVAFFSRAAADGEAVLVTLDRD